MKFQTLLLGLITAFGLSAQAGDMKLTFYKTAPGVPTSECENTVKLDLRTLTGRGGARVQYINTENGLHGECRRAVNPNPQSYVVTDVKIACGSKIYEATSTTDSQETLRLVDHTMRVCLDIVPAKFILQRVHPAKKYAPMYSDGPDTVPWPHPSPNPVTEIKDAVGITETILENPQIGEALRHNGLTRVTKITVAPVAAGIVVFKLEAVSRAMRGPGRALVRVTRDTRRTIADGPIEYDVNIEILE